MNIIETHQLTRHFGRTDAVERMDLSVPEGAVCALLGPNGAGKTTTVKLLLNLISPTSGSASVMGVDSRRLGQREFASIGYVSENQQLPLWMTVRQFLDYCRPFYPTWDRALESSMLEEFDLPVERRLKHLSRGMLMKAALVSSLAYRPKLLVLDEPFSGLDAAVRDDLIHGMLEAVSEREWTVLVSTQDIHEVEQLADNIAMLDHGQLRLSEGKEVLQARFRRVELSGMRPDSAPIDDVLEWQQAESRVTFVVADYQPEASEKRWRELLGPVTPSVQPMTLREIFVILARMNRRSMKGAAA